MHPENHESRAYDPALRSDNDVLHLQLYADLQHFQVALTDDMLAIFTSLQYI